MTIIKLYFFSENPLKPTNDGQTLQVLACSVLSSVLLTDISPKKLKSLFLLDLEKVILYSYTTHSATSCLTRENYVTMLYMNMIYTRIC